MAEDDLTEELVAAGDVTAVSGGTDGCSLVTPTVDGIAVAVVTSVVTSSSSLFWW